MLATALEFAPNTSEGAQKLILGMFDPQYLLTSYREARRQHKTGDLVFMCPNTDPENLFVGTRAEMRMHLQRILGPRAHEFKLVHESAHKAVQLPSEMEAFWLVVEVPGQDMPCMTVLYAIKYDNSSTMGEAS